LFDFLNQENGSYFIQNKQYEDLYLKECKERITSSNSNEEEVNDDLSIEAIMSR